MRKRLLNLPQNSSTRDRSQFLNDLFQRKAFSWTKAFEDLERVMPPRLHVVSIHPELSPDNELEIKVIVAGDTREHALDLVSKMEASQHFHDTYIEEENADISNTRETSAVPHQRALRAGDWKHRGGRCAVMPDLRETRHKVKIALGALAVVDVILIAVFFSPLVGSEGSRHQRLDQAWRELQQKTREVEPLRGLDKKIPLARKQIDQFYAQRLPSQDSAISADLGKVAAQSGVKN